MRTERFLEHLALEADCTLEEFCRRAGPALGAEGFEFDCENETEWAVARFPGWEFNVSRPFETGTLQRWDPSVPPGCNFGVTLFILEDAPESWTPEWSRSELVPRIAGLLRDSLGCEVHHHRRNLI